MRDSSGHVSRINDSTVGLAIGIKRPAFPGYGGFYEPLSTGKGEAIAVSDIGLWAYKTQTGSPPPVNISGAMSCHMEGDWVAQPRVQVLGGWKGGVDSSSVRDGTEEVEVEGVLEEGEIPLTKILPVQALIVAGIL